MAKGYWVVRVDVHDPDAYQRYVAANGPAFAKFGARFLVRAGRSETLEGSSRSRNVVIEFPSFETALACWHSPEYQEVIAFAAMPRRRIFWSSKAMTDRSRCRQSNKPTEPQSLII